ncbi:MFS transporter [Cnuibacter physcomitrellae]|uniref:MFS transporter n=1 Tax=Cnuibacter physcomitrellae TaxID=1619308 RepID=UPI0021757981|nr:MFS transporter [Cnuibacter physcomitrellae]MCS5498410.1 MFS transporter [Cnuibacter physcomitrellae]
MTRGTDRGRIAGYALINLVVLGSLTAPVVTALPLRIAELVPAEERASSLAFVTVCGAIAALVANPLFGVLSDRTRGRLGRRRPWLLAGVLVGWVASLLVVIAPSVGVLAVAWTLAQTAYNASLAAVAALLGDGVSERSRASASGIFGAAAFLGTLPPLVLAGVLPSRVDVVVLAMPTAAVLVVAAAVLLLNDPPLAAASAAARGRLRWPDRDERRALKPFAAVWVQRALMHLSFGLVTSFALFLVSDRMRISPEAAGPVVALMTFAGGAAIVVSALTSGFLAGRRGDYRPFIVVAALGLAVASVLRGVGTDTGLLVGGAALGGLALGAFYAVDLAMALRAVPEGRHGTYLGVLNMAETLPGTVSPAIASALLLIGGRDPVSGAGDDYLALCLAAAVVALCALLPLPALRGVLTRDRAPEGLSAPVLR